MPERALEGKPVKPQAVTRQAVWPRIVLALISLGVLAMAGMLAVAPAIASPAGAAGVNATVKIHDDEPEPDPEIQNQPHVCTFHVHGFNFDEGESGVWWIQGWPPTGGPPDADPAHAVMGPEPYMAVEDDGEHEFEWRTTERVLPDGHYKLFVEQTHTAGSGDVVTTYKHKVFWVECEAEASVGESESAEASVGESESAEASVGESESAEASVGESESAEASVGESESAEASVGESESAEGSLEGDVLGGTGTPAAGEVPDTSVGAVQAVAPSVVLSLLLATSLVALAYVNVVSLRRRR